MTEAYTVSKMLTTINEVMAPVATETCAAVSLKRKMDNGVMLDTSEKEIAYLDMKSKIKHAAQQVAPLGRSERLCWISEQRTSAKDAFERREYQRAAECYIQALTALDFGKTDEEKHETQQQVQIPLTCNLAACMLMLEQWEKAKRICDQALALDPNCVRASQQRAKALTKLHKFDDARAAIDVAKRALAASASSSDPEKEQNAPFDKQLADIARAEVKYKHSLRQQRAFQKNMMVQAVGKLYAEKENVKLDVKVADAELPFTARFVSQLRQWSAALVQRVVSSVCVALRSLTCATSQQKHIKTA